MISNGIKAIQKFEEFLDNSIEEDCFYECPKVFMYKILNSLCTDMCVYCTSNGSGLGLRWLVYFFPFEPVLRIHNMLVWIRIWIRVSRKTDYWLVAQYYVFLLEWPALRNDQYHNCKTRMAGKLEWPESRTDRNSRNDRTGTKRRASISNADRICSVNNNHMRFRGFFLYSSHITLSFQMIRCANTMSGLSRGHKEISSILADPYSALVYVCAQMGGGGGRGVAGCQPMSTAVHIEPK